MKVVIYGNNPFAVIMSVTLIVEDASVQLIANERLLHDWRRKAISFHESLYPDEHFLNKLLLFNILSTTQVKKIQEKKLTQEDLYEYYLRPLAIFLYKNSFVQRGKIEQVSKCFLNLEDGETLRERMKDSFKVLYEHEKWGESYLECDFFVDAREDDSFVGSSRSLCLGERRSRKMGRILDKKEFPSYVERTEGDLCFIGKSENIKKFIESEEFKIFSLKSKMAYHFIVEEEDVSSLLNASMVQESKKIHEEDLKIWKQAVSDWDELDDFIKVKKKKPLQPEERFSFYSSYSLLSVNYLTDREKIYLTMEKNEQGEVIDSKTIECDYLVNLRDQVNDLAIYSRLRQKVDELNYEISLIEEGVYFIGENKEIISSAFSKMMGYFSRREDL